jgi:hypothetical protein
MDRSTQSLLDYLEKISCSTRPQRDELLEFEVSADNARATVIESQFSFSLRSAVNPMGRRLGAGGCMS